MRETPCASCGDVKKPVALQAGRILLCDACTRAIPEWFFAADEAELDAIFGEPLSRRSRTDALVKDGPPSRASLLELAVAAQHAVEPFDDIARLLERAFQRNTLSMLARAVGLHLHTRSGTFS